MEFFLWPLLFLLNPYFHGKIEKNILRIHRRKS